MDYDSRDLVKFTWFDLDDCQWYSEIIEWGEAEARMDDENWDEGTCGWKIEDINEEDYNK